MKIIKLEDQNYPPLLKEIFNPPQKLYLEGDFIESDFEKLIAIVGTRKFSSYGKEAAIYFAENLARAGLTIVSGLARGIDTFAHQSALEVGGRTIAVLGSGLSNIYPSENKQLARNIIKSGVLVSEFEPDEGPLPYHFPQRNRIIAGLSKATLVIEAPIKSGSLITARFALEQNREVFCVPGSIFSNNSEGTNYLISEGAKLVSDYREILREFGIETEDKIVKPIFKNQEENLIYEIILDSDQAISVDEIIKISRLTPQLVNATISMLELTDVIKDLGGGKYTVRS
ncbi:DNA-protecting protein DprA [Candidatus Azambacteria bacterium]|nr:DNA-protecting protein DprA [Candidatus Azambacteria bacterium]